MNNLTRVCEQYIPDTCLAVNSAEVCTNQLIDRIHAEQAAGGRTTGPPVAAVVVPVVLGGWVRGGGEGEVAVQGLAGG